jgi:hypothetical protein
MVEVAYLALKIQLGINNETVYVNLFLFIYFAPETSSKELRFLFYVHRFPKNVIHHIKPIKLRKCPKLEIDY